MNLLFITLGNITDIAEHGIYTDLLREFVKHGHNVYVVSPFERRYNQKTQLIKNKGCTVLKVRTGNIQKTNLIEKGISTVLLETQLIKGIKKYYFDVEFDLVLYSTPPVTISGVVEYVKKRDGSLCYLMLKDIFPQNALDLGYFKKNGPIYKFFRHKEKKLYSISDYIGCTSDGNIDFLLTNNRDIPKNKAEICVNCIEPYGDKATEQEIYDIREKYSLPQNKTIFVYGGNLGQPQGIDFLMECLEKTKDLEDAFFLIVGAGTEYKKLESFIQSKAIANTKLMPMLPVEEFSTLAKACDVGMIFLNYKNTTPNTPSRLLAYTNARIPILSVNDPCTDVGKIIENGKFGWSCISNDSEAYRKTVLEILKIKDFSQLKDNAYNFLLENYTASSACEGILKHF